MLDYIYACEAENFTFYRIPKTLFTGERYKSMSTDAKVLYGLLFDRVGLSTKYNWVDEEGRVYIIFAREEAQELLGCSKPKIVKLYQELTKYGLIEEKRVGLNTPNIIYVKKFHDEKPSNPLEQRRLKNLTSGGKKILPQEVKKFNPNDTDINDTDINNVVVDETGKYVKGEEQNAVQEFAREKIGVWIPEKTIALLLAKYGKEKVKEKILYMSRKKIHENAVGYLVVALRDNYQNMPPPAKKHKKMVVETWGKAETIPKKYDKEEVRKRKLIQGLYLS